MKSGTYSTFDCPTEKIGEAYQFLKDEFEKVGGEVRKISNPHDFDSYPSFEIDYPSHLEYVDEDDIDSELPESDLALIQQKNEWINKANDIEKLYGEKFNQYL